MPTLAGVFLSTGIVLIFVSYLNYLTDTYLVYAASASAANTICRSVFGAVAPLFTSQMFHALGIGPAASLIAGVGCLLAPIPFLFYKYGERIRKQSKFAPTEEGVASAAKKDSDAHGDLDETASSFEKAAADEAAVVMDKDLEKATSNGSKASALRRPTGDPYLDANGVEKAERHR